MHSYRSEGLTDGAWRGSGDLPPQIGNSQPWLGRVLLVSLLVMPNLTLFFTLITGMDLYGFFTLSVVSARPLPALLSTLLNLCMATAGFTFYCWLWRRQAWFMGKNWDPFTRGAILSTAPVLLAHAPAILLTSNGGKPTQIIVAVLMAGALTITHALRDAEMRVDPSYARFLFAAALSVILVFLCLAVVGMVVLHASEQMPAVGNLLWRWDYRWEDLGYPREDFDQRQRDALVCYTITGSAYMIVALGGSMLGAIMPWTRAIQSAWQSPQNTRQLADALCMWTQQGNRQSEPLDRQPGDAPEWIAQVVSGLDVRGPFASSEAEYLAAFNGYEMRILASQYEDLVGRKDNLPQDVKLIVNKAALEVFVWSDGTWVRLVFRAGRGGKAIAGGPFALLCIMARNPGRRFTTRELRDLLKADLKALDSPKVRDLISQLQKKDPPIPVKRDENSWFLDDSIGVCFLERHK